MSKSFNPDTKSRMQSIIELYDTGKADELLILELLEDLPSDQLYETYRDDTLLVIAGEQNHEQVVKYLLNDLNFDVNYNDNFMKDTPLMKFIWRKDSHNIVKILLSAQNIDVNIQDKYGDTAVMTVVGTSVKENIKLILNSKEIDPNLVNEDGNNLLQVAIYPFYEINKFIEQILALDIDINHQNNNKETAFIMAAKNKNFEIMRKMKQLYPNLNTTLKDNNGKMALDYVLDEILEMQQYIDDY